MEQRRLFDYNPVFGITRYSYYDPDKDELHIETVQDVEPLLELNKAQFNSTDEHARYADGMNKVATIPLHILEDLIQKGILVPGKHGDGNGNKRFKAWLNDRDNRLFRTRPGRL
jgi:hypothetical protein